LHAFGAIAITQKKSHEPSFMSETNLIHLAADLSHYHTDYLW
jgi:hypothetical protein